MTLEQAKNLTPGQTLYCSVYRNSDGTPQRWRVNGVPKTWKRSPERVRVPLKHGLYDFDYLTELQLTELCLTEEEAIAQPVGVTK